MYLLSSIFYKFYKNSKVEDKEIWNNIRIGIKEIFNSGNFILETEDKYIKQYRNYLKNFIQE